MPMFSPYQKHGLEDLGISTVDKAQSPATPPESVLSSTMSSADLDEKVRQMRKQSLFFVTMTRLVHISHKVGSYFI